MTESFSVVPLTSKEIVEVLGQETIDNLAEELEIRIGPAREDLKKGRPFQIAKEAWEYAFADSLEWNGGEWVGNGSSPEDVRMGNCKFDIKGLGGKWTTTSGEASIKQCLSKEARIAESFTSGDKQNLWDKVVEPWIDKVFVDGNYYFTIFWRNKETLDVRLVMMRIERNKRPIYNPDACNFSDTNTYMEITNIMDPEQAKVYVLRSKNRMEMRIKGSFFKNPEYHKEVYTFKT